MADKNEEQENGSGKRFDPRQLDWTIIARPLLKEIRKYREELEAGKREPNERLPVVIDLNFKFHRGLTGAKQLTLKLIDHAVEELGLPDDVRRGDPRKQRLSQQYLFAELEADLIERLAKSSFFAQEAHSEEEGSAPPTEGIHGQMAPTPDELGFIYRPVFMIWPDFEVRGTTLRSISTVKADAAHRAFSALGENVVWAVLDSGIDGTHVHFEKHGNLDLSKLDPPLRHKDFTRGYDMDEEGNLAASETEKEKKNALTDEFGHGTHVAGIIAGEARADSEEDGFRVATKRLDHEGKPKSRNFKIDRISGMAPMCKLVSMKVLDKNGRGPMSNLLAALAEIQEINEHGRWLKIHGINMSVGYDFDPEWFACGQSPLCQEVDRLVKSGVVVVAAAGNTGYGFKQTTSRGPVASGMLMSINDPGNAEMAITVGSTHREMPHVYGVSFFSSKGPTGDGRIKPDLVAPGERIVSCAAGSKVPDGNDVDYVEDSGTSMAAPHVSGVIAAFLSIRREFIGRPEHVKEIFVENATDLRRQEYLQGNGLVDLMRSIQAV